MRNAPHVRRFGALLRDLRVAAGLTQEELAERAGLSVRGLQKLEAGESLPYRATALRLGQALSLEGRTRAEFLAAARPDPPRPPVPSPRPTPVGFEGVRRRVDELTDTGSHTLHAGLLAEAMAAFDRALALLDAMPASDDVQRLRLLLLGSLWAPYAQLGRVADYEELLTRAEPLAVTLGDAGLLGLLSNRLAFCRWAAGDLERARRMWMKALDLCQVGGNPAEAAVAHVMLQWCRLTRADYLEVLLCHEQTLLAIDEAPNVTWHVWALIATTCAYALRGHGDLALVEAEEALAVAEEAGDVGALAGAGTAMAFALAVSANPEAARAQGQRAVELARTPLECVWAKAIHGLLCCRDGETATGLELLSSVLPVVQAMHVQPVESSVLLALGEGSARAGFPEAARTQINALLHQAEPSRMLFHVGVAHRLLGEVALDTSAPADELTAAAAHFDRSIDVLSDIGAEHELALAHLAYGRQHQQGDDAARARTEMTSALQIFSRLGATADADRTRQRLAELASEGNGA